VLADRWVRPHAGVGFPVDVGAELNPAALAALVTAMAEHLGEDSPTSAASESPGTSSASTSASGSASGSADEAVDDEPVVAPGGRPAQLVTAGEWSALVTTEVPRRLVWLAGPLRDGAPVAPAVATGPAEVDAPVWRTDCAGNPRFGCQPARVLAGS
jgi:hypothetical protein